MRRRHPSSVSSVSSLVLVVLRLELLLLLSAESHALSTTSDGRRTVVEGRAVHKTHLNPSDAVVASIDPIDSSYGDSLASSTIKVSPFTYSIASILDLDSTDNFLATQVWPSARVAARALLQYDPDAKNEEEIATADHDSSKWKLCEFGCGPGLPSLAAAHTKHYSQVVATDVDEFCLSLVQSAAEDQGLEDIVRTQILDLTKDPMDLLRLNNSASFESRTIRTDPDAQSPSSYDWIKGIDLFVMADIFENAQVAKGAAAWTKFLLNDLDCSISSSDQNDDNLEMDGNVRGKASVPQEMKKRPRVWVFAQSDRAQREIYLDSLREIYGKEAQDLKWLPLEEYDETDFLRLVDLDETQVQYG